MYSCCTGTCLVNEASMRRPRTASTANSTVSSANSDHDRAAMAEDELLEAGGERAGVSVALDVTPSPASITVALGLPASPHRDELSRLARTAVPCTPPTGPCDRSAD